MLGPKCRGRLAGAAGVRFLTKDWQDWKNQISWNLYEGLVKPLDRGSDGHPEGMIEFCVGEGGAFPPFRSVLPRARSTGIGPPACLLCLD